MSRDRGFPAGTPLPCFGRLEEVFPLGADGLRASPERCLACEVKVDCLRRALATPQGAAVNRGGPGDGSLMSRVVKGLGRWSRLKAQNRDGQS